MHSRIITTITAIDFFINRLAPAFPFHKISSSRKKGHFRHRICPFIEKEKSAAHRSDEPHSYAYFIKSIFLVILEPLDVLRV